MRFFYLIGVVIFSFVFTKAEASVHAGEITYKWLYGYTYEIKYTIYTGNAVSDNYCDINPECSQTGVFILRSNGPSNGPCSPGQEGINLPGSNYKLNEYVAIHTFPGPGNYSFCLEVPNRASGVINIPGSVNQVMYLESYLAIPTFGTGKNTSTVFGNPSIANGCSNNGCYTYNPSATDIDGDSLSYEIAQCKGYSGATTPGYAYPGAGSSGTFSINPITGTLSWCSPQMDGLYNVVIRIKEWRNDGTGTYSLIGYVERDTEFSMATCTGILDLQRENAVNIFPNPVGDELAIQFTQNLSEAFAIELIDVTGRKIKIITTQENITPQHSIQLNLEGLNPGIYFLKINGRNHSSITKKIVKQ